MDKISLIYTCDRALEIPMAVSVASAVLNCKNPDKLEFHIVSQGVSERTRFILKSYIENFNGVSLKWHDIDKKIENTVWKFYTKSSRPYPPSTYIRLMLPQIIPKSIDRAIYLDSDTLVRHDIEMLWSTTMNEKIALAVADLPHTIDHWSRIQTSLTTSNCTGYDVSSQNAYFQSGLLVLDMKEFREQVSPAVIKLVDNCPSLQFPDQDALNIVMAGRTGFLDPAWNQMTSVYWYGPTDDLPYSSEVFTRLRDDPFIVHFSGRPKPWEQGCLHPFAPAWREMSQMIGFSGEAYRTVMNNLVIKLQRRFMKSLFHPR